MSRRPNHYGSKITLDEAERIRRDYEQGESVGILAERHGATRNSIYEILRGRSHMPTISLRLDSAAYARLRELAAARGTADLAAVAIEVVAAGLCAIEEPTP